MDLIQEYLNAYLKPESFNAVLADTAKYISPTVKCEGREELVEALTSRANQCSEINIEKIFAHDNEVCAVYGFVTSTGSRRVVDLIVVEDGKILSIDQTFDATEVNRRNCEI